MKRVRSAEEQWLQQQVRDISAPDLPPPEGSTIHWTDLPESPPSSRVATEWNYYLNQVGRLLEEGHEGKWVLIKGEAIIGIWNTELDAKQVRLQQFSN